MRQPTFREAHLAETRREARLAFASHEIVSLSPRSASFASPNHGDRAFDVAALGWCCTVVHGNFKAVVFQGGDGGDVVERVDWLASMDAFGAGARAQRATGKSYDTFHPKAFAECVLRYAEGETGQRRRELKAIALEAAHGDLGEHDAIVQALELGVEFDASCVSAHDESLVYAHEAARAAHRLLRPAALFERFCRWPSAESLAWYNLAVRGSKNRFHARVAAQLDYEARYEPTPRGRRRA